MTARKNAPPADIWKALRRLRDCNKQELAAALGISRHTLSRWEAATEAGDSPGTAAYAKASALLIATLRAAKDADSLAQWQINWTAIDTVGGKR